MRNQTSFRLTTTLLPSDTTAKTTTVINKLDAGGNKFYPTFTEETVVLTNDDRTIMETTKATCTNGVLTFIKRGLSDDLDPATGNEYEIANRKLTWNPGSIAFITAGASDILDKDDDIVWSGNQTFTGSATYQGALITRKGVKYPSFATFEDLEDYEGAFGGMFATVDSTGELYRYNAVTEQWDLVSTVALGTYEIRVDDESPASGTSDTIVTFVPNLHSIYVGDDAVLSNNYVDVLLVGGGGGGGGVSATTTHNTTGWSGGGGGGGGVNFEKAYKITGNSFAVKVGAGGAGGDDATSGDSGGDSSFGLLSVMGGGGGGAYNTDGIAGANGGGGGGLLTKGGVGYATSFTHGFSGGDGTNNPGSYKGGSLAGQGASPYGDGTISTALSKGVSFNIGGTVVYASEGGGGGYGWHNTQSGGSPNYQAGAGETSNAIGGGGGGAGRIWDNQGESWKGQSAGGNGKGGVVIVAYPTDGSYGFTTATGGTITTSTIGIKQYKVHTFTADGTFTIIS